MRIRFPSRSVPLPKERAMSKKQTRRSISVRGVTYDRLREYCAGASISMSDFVEQRIADFFAGRPELAAAPAVAKPAPVVARPAAPPAPRPAPLPAPARVAVARTEKSPPPPARSLPATSAIALKKPQPTLAMKVSAP